MAFIVFHFVLVVNKEESVIRSHRGGDAVVLLPGVGQLHGLGPGGDGLRLGHLAIRIGGRIRDLEALLDLGGGVDLDAGGVLLALGLGGIVVLHICGGAEPGDVQVILFIGEYLIAVDAGHGAVIAVARGVHLQGLDLVAAGTVQGAVRLDDQAVGVQNDIAIVILFVGALQQVGDVQVHQVAVVIVLLGVLDEEQPGVLLVADQLRLTLIEAVIGQADGHIGLVVFEVVELEDQLAVVGGGQVVIHIHCVGVGGQAVVAGADRQVGDGRVVDALDAGGQEALALPGCHILVKGFLGLEILRRQLGGVIAVKLPAGVGTGLVAVILRRSVVGHVADDGIGLAAHQVALLAHRHAVGVGEVEELVGHGSVLVVVFRIRRGLGVEDDDIAGLLVIDRVGGVVVELVFGQAVDGAKGAVSLVVADGVNFHLLQQIDRIDGIPQVLVFQILGAETDPGDEHIVARVADAGGHGALDAAGHRLRIRPSAVGAVIDRILQLGLEIGAVVSVAGQEHHQHLAVADVDELCLGLGVGILLNGGFLPVAVGAEELHVVGHPLGVHRLTDEVVRVLAHEVDTAHRDRGRGAGAPILPGADEAFFVCQRAQGVRCVPELRRRCLVAVHQVVQCVTLGQHFRVIRACHGIAIARTLVHPAFCKVVVQIFDQAVGLFDLVEVFIEAPFIQRHGILAQRDGCDPEVDGAAELEQQVDAVVVGHTLKEGRGLGALGEVQLDAHVGPDADCAVEAHAHIAAGVDGGIEVHVPRPSVVQNEGLLTSRRIRIGHRILQVLLQVAAVH